MIKWTWRTLLNFHKSPLEAHYWTKIRPELKWSLWAPCSPYVACSVVAQSWHTLCNLMDCSPPGSSVNRQIITNLCLLHQLSGLLNTVSLQTELWIMAHSGNGLGPWMWGFDACLLTVLHFPQMPGVGFPLHLSLSEWLETLKSILNVFFISRTTSLHSVLTQVLLVIQPPSTGEVAEGGAKNSTREPRRFWKSRTAGWASPFPHLK